MAAREIVVETWLNAGFDPIQYAESIQAVRDGKHDSQTNVKLALAGIAFGRRARARRDAALINTITGKVA